MRRTPRVRKARILFDRIPETLLPQRPALPVPEIDFQKEMGINERLTPILNFLGEAGDDTDVIWASEWFLDLIWA
jgi:hypothetical protein